MEGTYEVISGGQAVGSVILTREGLYYHFVCRCHISGEVMFRLIMVQGHENYDLGILTPMDGCFGLNTKLAISKVGTEKPRFALKIQKNVEKGLVSAVCPEEPFRYLSRLEDAFLIRKEGKMMIGFHSEK